MSDHIPLEIQIEIMKRLPIKSLIQFRYVSKAWKSVIESSNFITDYTLQNHHAQPQQQQQHLLIRYKNPSYEEIYVSMEDDNDDSFPQNKFCLNVPYSVDLLYDSFFVGSSRGLVCLFGYYRNPGDFKFHSGTKMAVIWNPLIGKSVAIVVPNVDMPSGTYFGFGVCPATIDPKIVKIRKMKGETCNRWQVEVFSLSSGVWKVLSNNNNDNNNLSDKLVDFCSQVTIDGFIYWFGYDNLTDDTGFHSVISFDLSCEEFREIDLPDEVAFEDPMDLFLLKRNDSLAVLKGCLFSNTYEVWLMENGDSKSFTKMFTVKVPNMPIWPWPLEFRRNGELMMGILDEDEDSDTLMVYEPFSEHINDIGIKGRYCSLHVTLYTESLLLFDQQDTFDDDEDDDDEEMSV